MRWHSGAAFTLASEQTSAPGASVARPAPGRAASLWARDPRPRLRRASGSVTVGPAVVGKGRGRPVYGQGRAAGLPATSATPLPEPGTGVVQHPASVLSRRWLYKVGRFSP